MLGHDWASPEATHQCYDLFARKVIPHFKGQLDAPSAPRTTGPGAERDQLIGRAGEAVIKAITEQSKEHKSLVEAYVMRASVLRDGRMVYRDEVPEPVPESGQALVGGASHAESAAPTCISPLTDPPCRR